METVNLFLNELCISEICSLRTVCMDLALDTSRIYTRSRAARKIVQLFKKKRNARFNEWAQFCVDYALSQHAFAITRLRLNIYGYDHRGNFTPVTDDVPYCDCGRLHRVSSAIYYSIGPKMLKSTPYMTFLCDDCLEICFDHEEFLIDQAYEDYYHEPQYLNYKEYNNAKNAILQLIHRIV